MKVSREKGNPEVFWTVYSKLDEYATKTNEITGTFAQ